ERNGVLNTEFILGKAEEVAPNLKKENPAVVFLDPPRKGADKKALEAIITMAPEKIVYISCNVETLARDMQYLLHKGYRAEKIQPVDMFPHTRHVETVVCLTRYNELSLV
ncbi:MAG: class I SAM-dependent RNA methyltransferase, partial [Clostridia bacterium]|nr:class I SAM-dependent RNA methyltransferase [Clostridia bacterium]